MDRTVVIGGGPAGMMAALTSAMNGKKVTLIEKNEKLGKKLYITGKGRCNLSNFSMGEDFLKNIVTNKKFLYASMSAFSSEDTYSFFENNGLKLKVERGNRVFPESDKASDVTKILNKLLINYGVDIRLNTIVNDIDVLDGQVKGVKTSDGYVEASSVICATGGVSYPLTGSTGDGFNFAKGLGHSLIDLRPSLVGIEIKEQFCKQMQGLSLKNVRLTAKTCGKTVFSEMGEMLFTHFGVSGPIVLSCSAYINRLNLKDVELSIDLKPALSNDVLDQRLIREFSQNNNKTISTVLGFLLPKSMVEPFCEFANLKNNKTCSEITLKERRAIIESLKEFRLTPIKLRPIDEAIVTSGGVNVKEINPKTLESKIVKGLYFVGEVLDVDALTGGFNIQIALSTGYLAGMNA